MTTASPVKNVVLVHGGFVDGSGWQGVYDLLKQDGYDVSVVQNPTLSLAGDVAATREIIDQQDGPVVLVGHSYGGAVITEAGTDPNVAALVYIAAFAPDTGESVNTLIADPPPGAPVPPILPPKDGFLFLDRDKFACLIRRRPARRAGCVHGRLAGPVGRGRSRRIDHGPRLADQAELVHDHNPGPNDPPAGAARYVRASGLHRGRGPGQSLRLRLATRPGRRPHRAGLSSGDYAVTAEAGRVLAGSPYS